MRRHVCRAAAVLALVFSPVARAAWSHRFDALPGGQCGVITALPNGGYAVGVNGWPSWIVILDANGEVKAARKIDGAELRFLSANARGEIYLIVRRQYPAVGSLLLKLHPDLAIAWTRMITTGESDAGFDRVASTRDGGVVVACELFAGTVITKLGPGGDVEWTTRVDPSGSEVINAIEQTKDGGYLAAGSSPRWPWLIRLSGDGTLSWQRAYGPERGSLQSVAETANGDIVASGNSTHRAMVLRTNGKGDVLWARVTPQAKGEAVLETANGTIASFTNGARTSVLHLVAMKTDGTIEWERTFDTSDRPLTPWGFEAAMLAAGGNAMALPIARGGALTVFSAALSTGPTDCGWTAGDRSELTPATLRDENVVIEQSRPKLTSREANIRLLPLDARASQALCADPPAAPVIATAAAAVLPDPYRYDVTIDSETIIDLLVARKFDELEKLAATARNQWSHDPLRPNLPIHNFYFAFNDNGASLEVRLQRTREWLDRSPASIPAHIARARVLYDAAWISRGNGFSDTVTAAGGAGYEKLMAELVETLDCAGTDATADPHYWHLAIAATGELGLGDVRQTGLHALMLHPDPMIAEAVTSYLRPEWGGTPAIYMQFADAASRATERTYGDVMYVWLVSNIKIARASEEYEEYGVDWQRVRRGAERLIAMAPAWVPSYHRYAKLAYRHEDDSTLRMLFQRPELQWYDSAGPLWLHRAIYDDAKKHALGDH